MNVEDDLTERIQIGSRVHLGGCVLSPLLFNLCSETNCQLALEEVNEGLIPNGETINNIRYADDTGPFVRNITKLVLRLNIYFNSYDLKINLKKANF